MKKILILGGYGFIGNTIYELLTTKTNYIIHRQSRRSGCNILNMDSITWHLNKIKPDIIINAAASVGSLEFINSEPATIISDNIRMYLNLYEAIANINPNIKIINFISNCSYPGNLEIQKESEWWDGPIHDSVISFGGSKKTGYMISKCYEKQYGIKTNHLILPGVYGPNDYIDPEKTHALDGLIIRLLKAIKHNESEFTVWGTGTPIREWIYSVDVANIIKLILDEDIELPDKINLGSEVGYSILDLVNLIQTELGSSLTINTDTSKLDGDPIKILSKEEFNKVFNQFVFTPIKFGIRNTIKFYKEII